MDKFTIHTKQLKKEEEEEYSFLIKIIVFSLVFFCYWFTYVAGVEWPYPLLYEWIVQMIMMETMKQGKMEIKERKKKDKKMKWNERREENE